MSANTVKMLAVDSTDVRGPEASQERHAFDDVSRRACHGKKTNADMKKVTITLHGTLTYSAHRTLEIEVSDDADLATIAPETLNELADFDQIPWEYTETGFLEVTDYSVDSSTVIGADNRNPE